MIVVWKALHFNTVLVSISGLVHSVQTDRYFLANCAHSITSAQSASSIATLYTLTLCLVQQYS